MFRLFAVKLCAHHVKGVRTLRRKVKNNTLTVRTYVGGINLFIYLFIYLTSISYTRSTQERKKMIQNTHNTRCTKKLKQFLMKKKIISIYTCS